MLARVTLGSIEGLADALSDSLLTATLRVYHGCRVDDAGVFHRHGLLINDPAKLEDEVRRIVAESDDLAWMRPSIEKHIAECDSRDRDTGRVYLCLDDRFQVEHAGHYALYGSEWLQAFFSPGGFRTLRSRGVPTMREVDLPLEHATFSDRRDLARALLQEWTRIAVNRPDWLPKHGYCLVLRSDVPVEYVVGHYHPAVLTCPYEQKRKFVSEVRVCPSCSV